MRRYGRVVEPLVVPPEHLEERSGVALQLRRPMAAHETGVAPIRQRLPLQDHLAPPYVLAALLSLRDQLETRLIDVVELLHVDVERPVRGDILDRRRQLREPEEGRRAEEVEVMFPDPGPGLAPHGEVRERVAEPDEGCGEAQEDALEEPHEDDPDQGDEADGEVGQTPSVQRDQRRDVDELVAGEDQDGPEARSGDRLQEVWGQDHEHQEPRAMEHRGPPRPGASVDVHRTPNDDARHRQPSDGPGHQVADALCHQLPVVVRLGMGLSLVDGRRREQGGGAGDEGEHEGQAEDRRRPEYGEVRHLSASTRAFTFARKLLLGSPSMAT